MIILNAINISKIKITIIVKVVKGATKVIKLKLMLKLILA
jgi:hypothetical protein